MVRNLRGGSKHKKAKSSQMSTSEKVIMRDESVGEYYAYVSKAYGSGHFGVHIVYSNEEGLLKLSEKEHKGRISGRMRKQKYRNFVRPNDLVLIAKREFQTNDEKVDIIHVYKDNALRKLIRMGHVPQIESIQDNDAATINNSIVFMNEDNDEQESKLVALENDNNTTNTNENVTTKSNWEIDLDDI